MPKRIALFILGFVIAVGVFLVYQHFTGPALPSRGRPRAATGPASTLPLSYESRDEKGTLEYILKAEKATPVKDPMDPAKVMPGQFELSDPVATFYKLRGRTMEIRADKCLVVVDTASRGGGVGGRFLSTIRSGQLSGHVVLNISAQSGDGVPTRPSEPPEFVVYFDQDLDLDASTEVLSSPGGVHLRSDVAAFDGRGLELQINRTEQRLEYLRIEQGEKVLVRGVGGRALALTGAAGAPAQAAEAAPQPGSEPMAYKLTFANDVLAALGKSALECDHMSVLFMAAKSALAEQDQRVAGAAAARRGPAPTQPGEEDLVITMAGPMEMRPAGDDDLKMSDPRDVALQAWGSAVSPLLVKSPEFTARGGAGLLWYHKLDVDGGGRIEIDPGNGQQVRLEDLSRDTVMCSGISIYQGQNRAKLGPGTLTTGGGRTATAAASAKAPTVVSWKRGLDLELESVADPRKPDSKTLVVRRAVLDGAQIVAENWDLAGNLLEATIDNSAGPALQHLLVTGNVLVDSWRSAGGAAPPMGERDGLKANRLEIATTVAPGSQAPVPSLLTATGDVEAWRFVNKNRSAGAPALQRESLQAAWLEARLQRKAPATPRQAAAPATAAVAALPGQTFEAFDVTHLEAGDSVTVNITPPAGARSAPIVATAALLSADPIDGKATLSATPRNRTADRTTPARVAMGDNNWIQGGLINLEQSKEHEGIDVPGAGVFSFVMAPDKRRKDPVAIEVSWSGESRPDRPVGMTYDNRPNDNRTTLAQFRGDVAAVSTGAGGSWAKLTCNNLLEVQMRQESREGAATTPAEGLLAGASNLALDSIHASGNVDAGGASLGPDGKPVTKMRLWKAADLRYADATRTLTVPGAGQLIVEDYRADKPGDRVSSHGQSVFDWTGSLVSDGTAITFNKDVAFVFTPVKPFKLPGGEGPNHDQVKWVQLNTDKLTATLLPLKEGTATAVESPVGLGAGGNQELSKVTAEGRAKLTAGTFNLLGATMQFDVAANTATVAGQGDEPVTGVNPEGIFKGRRIFWDMTKDKQFFQVDGAIGNIVGGDGGGGGK